MRKIDDIIVHCTATPEGRDVTVAEIRKWHVARGFADVGYHYVVYLDGSVHVGRAVEQVGAHCKGHNTRSIGVCYVGGLASDGVTAKDTRTTRQKEGLRSLVKLLQLRFPLAKVHGHRDYAAKACPCFDVASEL